MKKALAIDLSFIEHPYYQRFAMAKESGFDYVALDGWTDLSFSTVNTLRQDLAIGIAAISGSQGYALTDPTSRDVFLEHLSQSIAVGRSFGCANLIITFAPGEQRTSGSSDTRDYTRMALATGTLMDATLSAAKAGMTLLLKPAGCPEAPLSARIVRSAVSVVRAVASPSLRLYYDAGLMRRFEGSVEKTVHAYRDVIGYVHVSDSPDGTFPVGLLALRSALEQELDYHGFIDFVIPSPGNH